MGGILRLLGNMCVIGDMLRAVAVVALAAGAVAEFQIGGIHIRAAADGALVGVGGLDLGVGGLVAAGGVEGDGLALGGMGDLLHGPAGIEPPGGGQQVPAVLAEGQEVVGQGDEGEEIVGEEIDDTQQNHHQIDQSKDPGLHGDDEEDHELGIGEEGGISQEQAQVQVVGTGIAAEDQAVHIHNEDAGEIEEIQPQGAPDIFDALTQGVVEDQHDGGPEHGAAAVQEDVGEQPPDLSPEDQAPVKAEPVIQGPGGIHLVDQVHSRDAKAHKQHQIGDTLVPVAVAKPVEIPADIFHGDHLVKSVGTILPVAGRKVQRGKYEHFWSLTRVVIKNRLSQLFPLFFDPFLEPDA